MSLEVSAFSASDIFVLPVEDNFANAGTGLQVVITGTEAFALPFEPGSATITTWQGNTFATAKEFQIYLDLLEMERIARIAGDENLQRQINELRLMLESVPSEDWLDLILDARLAELQAQIDAILAQARKEIDDVRKTLSTEIDAARAEISDTNEFLSGQIDIARGEIADARDLIGTEVGAAREELGGAIQDNKDAIEESRKIIDNLAIQGKDLINEVEYYAMQAADDPVLGHFMNSMRDHVNKVKAEMAVGAVNAQVERNTYAVAEANRAIVQVEEVALAKIGDVEASFETFKVAQVKDNDAFAGMIQGIEVKTAENSAAITTESAARAASDAASSKRIDTVQANIDKNVAAIQTETVARATATTALAARIDMIEAGVDGNTSSIATEQVARADADSALAGMITRIQVAADEAKAKVEIEAAARVDGDTALATRIENLVVVSGEGASAAIDAEAVARASADAALATQIGSLSATVTNNNTTLSGKITEEALARANADQASTTRIDAMGVKVGNNAAAIKTEELARANADSANAARIDSLSTKVDGNTAAITSESTARSTADSALSGRIDTVSAKSDTNAANISTEIVARTNADTALGSRIDTVSATASKQRVFHSTTPPPSAGLIKGDLWYDTDDGLKPYYWTGTAWADNSDNRFAVIAASVVTEQAARVAADDAIGRNITTITTQVNQNAAAISAEQLARTTSDTAIASDVSSLTTKVNNNAAAISSEQIARSTADSALSNRLDTVSASATAQRIFHQATAPTSTGRILGDLWYNTNDAMRPYYWTGSSWADNSDGRFASIAASVSAEQTARISADSAIARDVTSLSATVGGHTSAITAEQLARADGDKSLAADISSLNVKYNDNAAAITNEQIARADQDKALAADITKVSAAANAQRVFHQASAPSATGRMKGDLWYNTNDAMRPYYWTGTAWADNSDGRYATIAASVQTEAAARIAADSAMSQNITTLTSQYNGAMSAISTEQTTRASADSALSSRIDTQTVTINANKASLDQEIINRVSGDSALSSRIDTQSTTLGQHTASITTLTQSYNGMMAQWAVQGTIDNSKGGVRLTGIKKADGSGALWKFIIDANTEINGNLLVNGSINTGSIKDQAVSRCYIVRGTNRQTVQIPARPNSRFNCIAVYNGGQAGMRSGVNGYLRIYVNNVAISAQPVLGYCYWIDIWAGAGYYMTNPTSTIGTFTVPAGTVDGTIFEVAVDAIHNNTNYFSDIVQLMIIEAAK